ncbi:MAG: hypothetical protein ABJH28_09260 [Paraglaciecola sp.]|uniref:hypothetical protein n=1 Tax=Paraglaciecola sp. TaxID=1920173 RepID=UPI003265F92A
MFKILSILFILFSFNVFSNNIAFGTLKGIKVYDYSSEKITKIYFSSDATNKDVPSCGGVVTLTHSLRSEQSLNTMIGIAMTAYVSGKKVRAFSSGDTCEADFLALQDSIF